jgi:glutathione S-transferase
MKIKLYYTPKTRAQRVRWLLEELMLPYELIPIDLFGGQGNTAEYRKIHPHGMVPAMEVDGVVMMETGAMCHWLTEQVPEKNLAPAVTDPAYKKYLQWMYYVPGTMEPPIFLALQHTNILPEAQRLPQVLPWCEHRYRKVFEVLNDQLQGREYLVTDHFTTADLMVASVLTWLPKEIVNYPQLKEFAQRCKERPAYQRSLQV